MADLATVADVQSNLADMATTVAGRFGVLADTMTWDSSKSQMTWHGNVITAWPASIGTSQPVHIYGFTAASQIPSWVPKSTLVMCWLPM